MRLARTVDDGTEPGLMTQGGGYGQAGWQQSPAQPYAQPAPAAPGTAPAWNAPIHQPQPVVAQQQQPVVVVAQPWPAEAWQPRYSPPHPSSAGSPYVPQLVRRDGVFGLAVGLLLIALVFATALAMQSKLPGYAPAPAAGKIAAPAAATGN